MGRVDLIKHEIDDDAGDRDIEPEGEGPTGDNAVSVEALEQGPAEGHDDHGDDDEGQNGVRGEQGEIDGANPTLALEGDVADAIVVDEIGNQEGARHEEGSDHEFLVKGDLAGTNGGVAGGEEDGAGTVEGGVQCGVGEQVEFSVSSCKI